MSLAAAPLYTDISPAPLVGAAYWTHAKDGVRLRLGVFRPENAKGTILVFPGRTEYVEKYAPAAGEFAKRGFATAVIDWRGQGLADRLLDDFRVGHVGVFADYQKDVDAMVAAAHALNLPKPFFVQGHSMGGCIGLRSLYEGLDVAAASFTSPMWGIRIAPHLRPVAWALGTVMPVLGQGHRLPPGRVHDSYVLFAPFDDNLLTTDADMYELCAHSFGHIPNWNWAGQVLCGYARRWPKRWLCRACQPPQCRRTHFWAHVNVSCTSDG
jgi:lysophospholipase